MKEFFSKNSKNISTATVLRLWLQFEYTCWLAKSLEKKISLLYMKNKEMLWIDSQKDQNIGYSDMDIYWT